MVNKPIYSCILLTYLSREALLFTVLVNIPQHTCHLRHITVEILFVSGYLYYQIGKIFGLVFYLLSLICSLVFNFSQPFSFTHICASLRAFRGTHWQDLLLRFVLVLGDLYACLPLSTLPLFFPIYFFLLYFTILFGIPSSLNSLICQLATSSVVWLSVFSRCHGYWLLCLSSTVSHLPTWL